MPTNSKFWERFSSDRFKATGNYLKTLFLRSREDSTKLILIAACTVLGALFTLWLPSLFGQLITVLFKGVLTQFALKGTLTLEPLSSFILWIVWVGLGVVLCHVIQRYFLQQFSLQTVETLKNECSEKVDSIPMGTLERMGRSTVLGRILTDTELVSQTFASCFQQILPSLILILGVILHLFHYNWLLALCTLVAYPLATKLDQIIVKQSQEVFIHQQDQLKVTTQYVGEQLSQHEIVQAFHQEDRAEETFDSYNSQLFQASWKSQFASGLIKPMNSFISNLVYVVLCLISGFMAIRGKLSVGDIFSILLYYHLFSQAMISMSPALRSLQDAMDAYDRIEAFLATEEETKDPAKPRAIYTRGKRIKIKGDVEFKNVSFSYTPDSLVIKKFNCLIEAGQTVAIVGPTGAGKTTLVKLLMRFYEPDKGKISLDGVDISKYRKKELRSLFGVVPQDPYLFEGTIKENIRFGKPDATDEEVYEAAEKACADHFIRTLDHGYDTVVHTTSSLSTGQKQLIAIARAFLVDPRILILDEATSSVDSRTEEQIQKGLTKLRINRTSFIIAHRLSTIQKVDLILVMDAGGIKEMGTHRALLKEEGLYAKLYQAQFS